VRLLYDYIYALLSFNDLLTADGTLSTTRRTQKSQLFSSQMATSSLERKLLMAQENERSLESQLREKDIAIERLENDRRFLAQRELEEKEEKEEERKARDGEKVSSTYPMSNVYESHVIWVIENIRHNPPRSPYPTNYPPSNTRRPKRHPFLPPAIRIPLLL